MQPHQVEPRLTARMELDETKSVAETDTSHSKASLERIRRSAATVIDTIRNTQANLVASAVLKERSIALAQIDVADWMRSIGLLEEVGLADKYAGSLHLMHCYGVHLRRFIDGRKVHGEIERALFQRIFSREMPTTQLVQLMTPEVRSVYATVLKAFQGLPGDFTTDACTHRIAQIAYLMSYDAATKVVDQVHHLNALLITLMGQLITATCMDKGMDEFETTAQMYRSYHESLSQHQGTKFLHEFTAMLDTYASNGFRSREDPDTDNKIRDDHPETDKDAAFAALADTRKVMANWTELPAPIVDVILYHVEVLNDVYNTPCPASPNDIKVDPERLRQAMESLYSDSRFTAAGDSSDWMSWDTLLVVANFIQLIWCVWGWQMSLLGTSRRTSITTRGLIALVVFVALTFGFGTVPTVSGNPFLAIQDWITSAGSVFVEHAKVAASRLSIFDTTNIFASDALQSVVQHSDSGKITHNLFLASGRVPIPVSGNLYQYASGFAHEVILASATNPRFFVNSTINSLSVMSVSLLMTTGASLVTCLTPAQLSAVGFAAQILRTLLSRRRTNARVQRFVRKWTNLIMKDTSSTGGSMDMLTLFDVVSGIISSHEIDTTEKKFGSFRVPSIFKNSTNLPNDVKQKLKEALQTMHVHDEMFRGKLDDMAKDMVELVEEGGASAWYMVCDVFFPAAWSDFYETSSEMATHAEKFVARNTQVKTDTRYGGIVTRCASTILSRVMDACFQIPYWFALGGAGYAIAQWNPALLPAAMRYLFVDASDTLLRNPDLIRSFIAMNAIGTSLVLRVRTLHTYYNTIVDRNTEVEHTDKTSKTLAFAMRYAPPAVITALTTLFGVNTNQMLRAGELFFPFDPDYSELLRITNEHDKDAKFLSEAIVADALQSVLYTITPAHVPLRALFRVPYFLKSQNKQSSKTEQDDASKETHQENTPKELEQKRIIDGIMSAIRNSNNMSMLGRRFFRVNTPLDKLHNAVTIEPTTPEEFFNWFFGDSERPTPRRHVETGKYTVVVTDRFWLEYNEKSEKWFTDFEAYTNNKTEVNLTIDLGESAKQRVDGRAEKSIDDVRVEHSLITDSYKTALLSHIKSILLAASKNKLVKPDSEAQPRKGTRTNPKSNKPHVDYDMYIAIN